VAESFPEDSRILFTQEKRVLPDFISVFKHNTKKFWLKVTQRAWQNTGFFEAQETSYNMATRAKVLSCFSILGLAGFSFC